MSDKWITRPGKLGGKGFLKKPSDTQHKLLDRCVKKYGYLSCLRSVMVLNRNRKVKQKHGSKINKLKSWLMKKYSKSSKFNFQMDTRSGYRRSCRRRQ